MKPCATFDMRGWLAGVIALALGVIASSARAAETAADFYRDKTLTFIIGAAAGAAYDLVGRTVAAHLRRHIPGAPIIVVQNMPGAASLIMVNHLYNRAPGTARSSGCRSTASCSSRGSIYIPAMARA